MKKHSKKYREVMKKIKPSHLYTIKEALELVQSTSVTSFDSSIDIDIRLGVNPRHADQMVRGTVVLPHGSGKKVRILALVPANLEQEAIDSGADYVGFEEYLTKIKEGWIDVDVIVASPEVMPRLAKLGRILGPRGLMPNPRSGTATNNIGSAITEIKKGKVEFRVDKGGVIHMGIGKASFSNKALLDNAMATLRMVIQLKPLLVCAVCFIISSWYLQRFHYLLKFGQWICLFLGFFLLAFMVYHNYILTNYTTGVIIIEEANLYLEPNTESEEISNIYEGYTLTISRPESQKQTEWSYLRLSNGIKGWAKTEIMFTMDYFFSYDMGKN